jgi:hypothetical protein
MNGLLRHSANIHKGLSSAIFGTEYQAVYDSFTTKPNSSVASAQNTMVESLVNSGVWAKLDVFYVLAGHTNGAGESLINWLNPGTFDATAVNSPTFTAFEGFAGDGATSYIDLNYNPAANGINYSQDDAVMGLYNRSDNAAAGGNMGVFDGTGDYLINTRNATNNAAARINDDITLVVANANGQGMYFINRSASNVREYYKNKSIIANDSQASSGINSSNVFALALNNNSGTAINFKTDQLSMLVVGGCLTQTDVNNFTDAFEGYMDSQGKGVIT